MDYHRLRPQSVPHMSPKRGVTKVGAGIVTTDMPGPALDPEADADKVHKLLIQAMEAVRLVMSAIGADMGKAARAAGLWYHQPSPGVTARRAEKDQP